MNKKSIVKLGACSLLVSLLALTACSKKTEPKPNTTANKTTKTTSKTTSKTTNKTTKTVKTTTDAKVTSYNVYVDGVLANSESKIDVECGKGLNIFKHLKVEKVFDNGKKEELTKDEFKIETEVDSESEVGEYTLKVKYAEFEDTTIKVNVVPVKIDVSNLSLEQVEFTYDGSDKQLKIRGLEGLEDYVEVSFENGKYKDAGTYHAKVLVDILDYDFEVVNVPTYFDDITWSIKRADAKFTEINDPSKVCDGKDVAISYKTNVNCDVEIFFKEKGADDSTYTMESPKNAGEYTAKLVIADSANYNGEEKTIDFRISKAKIKAPYFDNASNVCLANTTNSLYDYYIGFNPEIMELDDEYSTEIERSYEGSYLYKAKIKESQVNNYEIINNEPSTWVIQNGISSFIASATINDEAVSDLSIFDTLEVLDSSKTYKFVLKDGYDILLDGTTCEEECTITASKGYYDFRIVYNAGSLDDAPLYVRTWFTDYYGVGYFKLNGVKHAIEETNWDLYNYVRYKKNENGKITLSFHHYKNSSVKVYYSFSFICGYFNDGEEKEITFMDYQNTFTATIQAEENTKIGFMEENSIKALKLTLLNLETNAIEEEIVNFDGNRFIYINDFSRICLNVEAIMEEGYEDYSVRFEGTCDFTSLDGYYNFSIYGYKDNINLGPISCIIHVSGNPLKGLSFEDVSNDRYLKFITNKELELPNYYGVDVYVDGVKCSDRILKLEESNSKIFNIEFKKEYEGVTYTYKARLLLISSDKINDYASEVYFYGKKNGTKYDINTINYSYMSLDVSEMIDSASDLVVTTKNGYTFNSEKSSIQKTDLYLYILDLVFEKDNNEYHLATTVHYYGTFSNDTSIDNEEIFYHQDYDGIDIINNEATIYTNYKEIEVSFKTTDYTATVEFYKDDVKIDSYSSSGTREHGATLNEGSYTARIITSGGATRDITINVIYVENLLEIYRSDDENQYKLFMKDGFVGNLLEHYSNSSSPDYISGFFKDSNYIIDGSYIDMNFGGLFLSDLYLDKYFMTKAKEKERLEVFYDESNNPYVNIYYKNHGSCIRITLYLCEKEKKDNYFTCNDQIINIKLDDIGNCGDLIHLAYDYYMIDVYSPVKTMTFTTSKVYDDYSYVIISGPEDVIDSYTIEELLENGYAYRVTNPTTLSVEVPITTPFITILKEGSTDLSSSNLCNLIINYTNLFEIEINGNTYYENVKIAKDGNYYEGTNADEKDGLYDAFMSNNLAFYIGASEKAKIDSLTNIYSFKFTPGTTTSLFVRTSTGNLPITVSEEGMLSLECDSSKEYLEFGITYEDRDRVEQTMYVKLYFKDKE